MKILFAGDCVLKNTGFRIDMALDQYDYRVVNIEAPIYSEGDKPIIKEGPSVAQSQAALEAVCKSGFNIVALANNHMMDYGTKALIRTKEFFHVRNILTMGAGENFSEVYAPLLLENGDERVAILNLAEAQFGVMKNKNMWGGYAWILHSSIKQRIEGLQQAGFFVIIYAHAGLENVADPLPEWQSVYHHMIDCGADCVIATHPHLVQGFECYKGKKVYYSLGNLAFDNAMRKHDVEWNRSLLVIVDTNTNEHEIIPCCYEGGVVKKFKSQDFMDLLAERCHIIEDTAELERRADLTAAQCWQAFYKSYYEAICPRHLVRDIIYQIWCFFTGKEKNRLNEMFVFHNIVIETHRWVVMRYLYQLEVEKNHNTSRL